MIPSPLTSPARGLAATLAAGALLLAAPSIAAAAYAKPPGGSWRIQNSFERTAGGAMTLAADGRSLTTLVLRPGESTSDACGTGLVRMVSKPRITKFSSAGGRWAVGAQRRGSSLIVPVRATFRVAGKNIPGTLVMLFDRTGRLASTAKVEIREACSLSFNARKPR